MKSNTTALVFILVVLILLGAGAYDLMLGGRPSFAPPQACTMEAKMCPDGSYVGRTGPLCQFATCPALTATSTGSKASGIRGTVILGPTCPVERMPPDPSCAEKTYKTLVSVFSASDAVHAIAITESTASGTFAFSLPSGDYTLGAGGQMLPTCAHTRVTVPAGTYAEATILCDTGIR